MRPRPKSMRRCWKRNGQVLSGCRRRHVFLPQPGNLLWLQLCLTLSWEQIMELESRNAALQSELDAATPSSLSKRNQDPASWLPTGNARHVLKSHRSSINCIAFHPVFSSIASGDQDATIKIWDWEFGELERTVKGHTRGVLGLDYGGLRGATLLASCSSDLTIKLWDPADEYRNIRTLMGHDHSISAVCFIPSGVVSSGNLLASASRDATVMIWDIVTGSCLRPLRGHFDWIRDVFPSPDGQFLLSAGDDRTLCLWDLSSQSPEAKLTVFGHENVIECCALAPAASYSHLASLAESKKPPPPDSTSEFMATGSRDKTIKLWDARGNCLKTLTGHDNWIKALVFHPGGKFIISAADDKTLRCWDLSQEGKCVKTLEVHEHFVTCLKWAPSLVKDAPAAGSGTAVKQDGESNGTPRKAVDTKLLDKQIRCVIATGSVDMTLKIYAN